MVARSPARGKLRVTTFAAPAFEHDLVFEKVRLDGRYPPQELLVISLVILRKVLPLPTEARSGRRLFLFNLAEVCETRHTTHDHEMTTASGAAKLAFQNL